MEQNKKVDKINEAVNDIIVYYTLPPQIDCQASYRIRAHKAEQFLETLESSKVWFKLIEKRINAYYDSEAPYMNSLL